MFCAMVRGWFGKSRHEYNGFVKALMADDVKTMNYYMNKVVLESKQEDDGIILEFKVQDTDAGKELADTGNAELQQIEEKKYDTMLIAKGVPKEKIRKYGFAFCGKQVLIGSM